MTTPTPHSADALKQTELLPCPCCGGAAQYSLEDEPEVWWVGCTVCSLSTDTSDDQAEVAAAWNRRPTPAPVCATCNDSGIVGHAPDDYFDCPECIKARPTPASPDLGELRRLAEAAAPDNAWPFNVNVFRKKLTPVFVLALLDRVERAEADSKHYSMGADAEAKSADEWRERALRAEAAAGAVPDGVLREITSARDTAMRNCVTARIPECGDFGEIAQGLDWVCDQLAAAPKAAPSQQAEAAPETNSTYIHRCERCNGLGHVETDTPAAAPSEPTLEGVNLDVIARSYGFALSADGEIHGLTAGDMGYEQTGIKLEGKGLEMWKAAWAAPSEPVAEVLNVLSIAANSVLHSHKLTNMQTDDGEPYPLIDLLSSPAPDTIASGQRQIELIVGAICAEFEAIAPAFATPPAQDAGTGDAKEVAEEVAREVIDHIDTMYPAMWSAVAKTARTSIRNTIINQSDRFIRAIANRGRTE